MDAVEDIKQKLSIEDVIGDYVELKRAGRNYKGTSPFSAERTPSFMVSPDKQIWHDFSSGRGGTMFGFVMEMEGVDFRGALEILARKAGIDLSLYQRSGNDQYKKEMDRMREVHQLATKYYQVSLSKSPAAIEYFFKKRGFSKEIALKFQIGYAPAAGRALADFLERKGYEPAFLTKSGLSTKPYNGRTRDMFRERLMIPLSDAQGNVVGFTGRLMADIENAPKYLNTPQSLIYDKGRQVYGLHLAKDAIRRSGFVVVVEGNLDVVAAHAAGTEQVVATAGTAMTEQHLKALSRFTDDIRLCFDADKAGLAATERIIPIAQKLDVHIRIITIPGAKDPDELIKANPDAWRAAIEQPADVMDWLIDRHSTLQNLSTQMGREAFKSALFATLGNLKSPGERGIYLKKIAAKLDYAPQALAAELRAESNTKQATTAPKKSTAKAAQSAPPVVPFWQDHFLALCLGEPGCRGELAGIFPELFSGDDRRLVFTALATNLELSAEVLAQSDLSSVADYVKILLLQYEELYATLDITEAQYEITRLRAKVVEDYVKRQKSVLAKAMQIEKNDQVIQDMLEKVKKLDQLLRTKGVLS